MVVVVRWCSHTETWCEEHDIEVREKLLLVCIEMAQSCNDVSWQTDANNLHNCLEDEQYQVADRRMRFGWLLKDHKRRVGRLHGH